MSALTKHLVLIAFVAAGVSWAEGYSTAIGSGDTGLPGFGGGFGTSASSMGGRSPSSFGNGPMGSAGGPPPAQQAAAPAAPPPLAQPKKIAGNGDGVESKVDTVGHPFTAMPDEGARKVKGIYGEDVYLDDGRVVHVDPSDKPARPTAPAPSETPAPQEHSDVAN